MHKKEIQFREKLLDDLKKLGLHGISIVKQNKRIPEQFKYEQTYAWIPQQLPGVTYLMVLARTYGDIRQRQAFEAGKEFGLRMGAKQKSMEMLKTLGITIVRVVSETGGEDWDDTYETVYSPLNDDE